MMTTYALVMPSVFGYLRMINALVPLKTGAIEVTRPGILESMTH